MSKQKGNDHERVHFRVPKVGDIVHFFPRSNDKHARTNAAEFLAAVVLQAWGDDKANLWVFPLDEKAHQHMQIRWSVPHKSRKLTPESDEDCWDWPNKVEERSGTFEFGHGETGVFVHVHIEAHEEIDYSIESDDYGTSGFCPKNFISINQKRDGFELHVKVESNKLKIHWFVK